MLFFASRTVAKALWAESIPINGSYPFKKTPGYTGFHASLSYHTIKPRPAIISYESGLLYAIAHHTTNPGCSMGLSRRPLLDFLLGLLFHSLGEAMLALYASVLHGVHRFHRHIGQVNG